jgi:hypothetical protein
MGLLTDLVYVVPVSTAGLRPGPTFRQDLFVPTPVQQDEFTCRRPSLLLGHYSSPGKRGLLHLPGWQGCHHNIRTRAIVWP